MSKFDQTGRERENWRGEKEKEREKREKKYKKREKLHLLSRFYGDRTVGFRRSKKKSSSMRQDLRVVRESGVFAKL